MFSIFSRTPRLSGPQKWGLAAGGVLTENSKDPFDRISLSYGPPAARVVLADWWDVRDRGTLLERLEWLKEEGHRMELRATIPEIEALVHRLGHEGRVELSKHQEFAVEHLHVLRRTSFEAWDGSRLIMVARWGLASGYLQEHEAWSWIMMAAKSIRLRLHSWKDVGDDFVLGYRYWSLDKVPIPSIVEAYARLTTNSGSPWRKTQWNIDPNSLTT